MSLRLSLASLAGFNGKQRGAPIYVAVRGRVYDVSARPEMYGPQGMYAALAGHDATLALARHSMDPTLLDRRPDGLSEAEEKTLGFYEQRMSAYPLVGTVDWDAAAVPAAEAASATEQAKAGEQAAPAPAVAAAAATAVASQPQLRGGHVVPEREFTLKELAEYDGRKGGPVYVAVQGAVFDVSKQRDELYAPGKPLHILAGRDASYAFATRQLREDCLNRPSDSATLNFDQLKTLYNVFLKFVNECPIAGVLSDAEFPVERKGAALAPLQFNRQEFSSELHVAIEAGDVERLRALLVAGDSAVLANDRCTRTFMSPLHKIADAVTEDKVALEMARLLVQAGGRLDATADLYDDDTPAKLARRLGRVALAEELERLAHAV